VTKQNRQFQDSHLSKQVFQQIPAVLCWPDIYATKSTILILQFEHSHLSKQVFQWITVVLCWPKSDQTKSTIPTISSVKASVSTGSSGTLLDWRSEINATKSTISILQLEHSHLSKKVFQWIPVVLCWPIRVTKQNRQFEYLHLPKQGFEWAPVVLCWIHRVA
jgi:hypothetical protein